MDNSLILAYNYAVKMKEDIKIIVGNKKVYTGRKIPSLAKVLVTSSPTVVVIIDPDIKGFIIIGELNGILWCNGYGYNYVINEDILNELLVRTI